MTRTLLASSFVAGILAASGVAAQQQSPLYAGAKIGSLDPDISGFDSAINAGLYVGYDLYRHSAGTVSAEGEFTTTISDGDTVGGGEWDADTLAAYGVFRTAGEFYGKAKAGFVDQDIKRAGGVAAVTGGDDTDFSFGVGGGWRMGRQGDVEVEYTRMSNELDFISVGYQARF